jgi:hypothetical protein
MPDGTVAPLRARAPAAYTDTAALNDTHTLLISATVGFAGRRGRLPDWR